MLLGETNDNQREQHLNMTSGIGFPKCFQVCCNHFRLFSRVFRCIAAIYSINNGRRFPPNTEQGLGAVNVRCDRR